MKQQGYYICMCMSKPNDLHILILYPAPLGSAQKKSANQI